MNLTKDRISMSEVKGHAVQGTVDIVVITILVSIATGSILTMFELVPLPVITNIIAFMAGLSLISYFFLKKMLGAMAHDAMRKGMTEDLHNEFER